MGDAAGGKKINCGKEMGVAFLMGWVAKECGTP